MNLRFPLDGGPLGDDNVDAHGDAEEVEFEPQDEESGDADPLDDPRDWGDEEPDGDDPCDFGDESRDDGVEDVQYPFQSLPPAPRAQRTAGAARATAPATPALETPPAAEDPDIPAHLAPLSYPRRVTRIAMPESEAREGKIKACLRMVGLPMCSDYRTVHQFSDAVAAVDAMLFAIIENYEGDNANLLTCLQAVMQRHIQAVESLVARENAPRKPPRRTRRARDREGADYEECNPDWNE